MSILYLAGNFPQMADVTRENEVKQKVLGYHPAYCRLLSFFYDQGASNVLQIKTGEYDASQNNEGV